MTDDTIGDTAHRHAHGLPDDPAMPGLGIALDEGAITRAMQASVFSGPVACLACKPTRFRYRAGERLIVVYDIDARDLASGATRQLVASGRIQPGRALRSRDASARVMTLAAPPAVAALPDLGLALEFFPRDRRIVALERYVTPDMAVTAQWLREVRGRRDGTGEVTGTVLRYRPGLSATIGLSQTSGRHTQRYFLKLTGEDDVDAESAVVHRVNARLRRAGRPLHLSVPVAIRAGEGAALFAAAAGTTLGERLQGSDALDILSDRVAAALADLHTLTDVDLPGAFASSVREKIARAERQIGWACPGLRARVGELGQLAGSLLDASVAAPVHRDMKPEHIFLDDAAGSVELIDNGSLCAGHPMADVGALLIRLDLLGRRAHVDPARVATFSRMLQDRYFPRVPGAWAAQLPAAIAYGRLLVATHLLQSLAPGWRGLVASLLEAPILAADGARAP